VTTFTCGNEQTSQKPLPANLIKAKTEELMLRGNLLTVFRFSASPFDNFAVSNNRSWEGNQLKSLPNARQGFFCVMTVLPAGLDPFNDQRDIFYVVCLQYRVA